MRKVVTIVGTRPELIKMSRVIAAFDQFTEHILVHTGQNFDHELNQVFFEDLDIRKPDHFLNANGDTACQTIANVLKATEELLQKEKPDALMLYGDTNSCLSVIPAKRMKIPVFHMEAGNRCYDQRVPEELNRKVVDHLSDVNMVLTEHARRNLLAEGLPGQMIFKVGSHMPEVLEFARPKIERSDILQRMDLEAGGYFLVSSHREENVDSPARLRSLLEVLLHLRETFGKRVIVSTHPRTRKNLAKMGHGLDEANSGIEFLKPFGFIDYIALQQGAYCVLSDSGTITEEAGLLNFPAVNVRQAHERPEGVDAGVLPMADFSIERIEDGVRVARFLCESGRCDRVADYAPEPVSKKVLSIVTSYIDYVNREIWKKHE